MSTRPLLKQLSWLLFGILLATTSTSQAQINPCQQSQQLCMNGAICRQAYLNPGYICECQGEWQGQNCEQRFPGITPSIPKECGNNFYSDSGVIVSTNYPLPPNDNEDCYYLVRIPSAESITFYFDAFHSENHKDGLIIYPGTTVNDQLPDLRTFIGTDQIAPQTVNTNQVVLYWYTDFNVPSGGFSIRYEADPDPCWVNPCQNGGLCNRIGGTGAGYQCNCPPDFSGVNCEIGTVIVAQTTIGVSSGIPVIQGRLSQSFTFDLTFSPGQTQFVLTGTGLWSVSLYLRDNLGNQFATQNVNVNNQQSSVSWQPPSASTIFSLQTTLNTNALSCTQVASICGVIGRGQSPSTPFSIRGVQGSTSLAGCTTVQCRGLEITQVDFGSSLRTLREGVNNQNIQFDFTAYTNPQAGQVSGTNLWKFTLFGSTQPNGLGNRVLTRSLTLNQGQLNAIPGPNGNIQFLGLETALSLNGLTCSQVQYICVTLGKADNPSPDFTMSGTPSDAVLTVCQSTTCRGVQVTDTSISVTSGNTLLERQSNTVGFTLSIFSSSSGGSVSGSNLFNIKTFGSNTQTGTSIRISERDVPGNIGITAGVLAVIPNLSTMLDLNNLLCQQVVALCTELSKGVNANPDFTLEPVQSTDVLRDCINMECRGVYISLMTINPTVNRQLQYGNRNHMLTFNLRIQADSPSASISGSNLWQLVVFASNQLNGQGTRRGQAVVTLTQSQMSAALSEGGQINFNNLQVTMDLSSVTSCAEIIYLCVQLQKSQAPNPDFTLQGNTVQCLNVECTSYNPCVSNPCQNNGVCSNTGNSYTCSCANGWTGTLCGTAVNACINHRCENGAVCLDRQFNYECQCTFGWTGNFCNLVDSGVILSRIQLFLANLALREGTANNNLNFNLMLTSDASGQTVSGTGLWSFNVFGSTQLDGSGQRYGLATAVYNSAQFTQLTAGGTLPINGVQASLDLSQVVCSQVPYLCVEVVPGASAAPAFRLSGDQVECAQINCQGVNIVNTQLQVVSSTTVVERDSSSPLTVDMTITTTPTSAGVSGLRLWRVTTFLSTQPDGSGTRFGQSVLQLSDAQSGLTLIPGQSAVMSALSVSANAASLMCGQFGYICAQLQKSPSSTVDFTLNSPSYVACAPVTCKGVEITDVVGTISSGVPVYSDTQNNVVVFDVTVSSNPNGASISGANLWEVIVFSDSQLDGQGTTVIQNSANLPGSSGSIFLQAGIDMVIRGAQVSLDLNGISCNQIPYICVQLRKAPNPNPDFTFTPVPSDDVLVHCQRLTCNACRSQNCLNGAVCVDVDPGLFRCDCTPGWTGTFCGIVADFCLTTQLTCLNGGQCISQSSSTYQCTCPQEWVGLRCQTDNPCLPNNPCLNGGTCFTDQNGIYTCTCINGYIGQNCHIAPNPCISNPCQNGGICERIGTGSNYDCLCTFGFEGQFCETLLDPCNSSPCLNGGNCSGIDMTYVYQCQCAQEYEGTNCQSRKNPCANNPCLNGGVCNQIGSANYQCSCTVGYTGTNCGSLINPCNNNPCLNNGRCIWSGTTIVYQCQCNAGFSGDNCQTFNMCVNVPCQNGGVCSQAGSSFTCQCAPGYTGNTCTQVINFCLANNNPCQNGGTCLPVGTSYQCQCLSGYTGNTCTTVIINLCLNFPCQNGGVCSQAGSSFTCQCAPGYTGNTCTQVINFCLTNNNPCRNGGTCLPVGTSYQCQCLSGYTGNTCTTVIINLCLNFPCQNGGVCSQAGSSFTCQCAPGYTGNTCTQVINFCLTNNNPCQNGGTCLPVGTSYQCQCLSSYTGNTCTTVIINLCLNFPCQNGGVCSQAGFSFTCQCAPGYTGNTCTQVINFCLTNSNPCQNGGTCLPVGTSYQCQCLSGYTGNTCTSVIINACVSIPCLNGGVCSQFGSAFQCQCQTGYSGLTCNVVQNFCLANNNPCRNGGTCLPVGTSWRCQCLASYTGNTCTVAVVLNPCLNNPCLNGGACQSGAGSTYTCQCTFGFTGLNCENQMTGCASNPCLNGGQCFQEGTGYRCQCLAGYTGTRCNVLINPCSSNPCQNNGICNWLNPTFAYQCQCQQSFSGVHCEIVTDPCISSPCFNGATCRLLGTNFQCQCAPGYTGNLCTQPINPCGSNPCLNRGVCSWLSPNFIYRCQCSAGYTGVNCGSVIDPCVSSPCLNGATCRLLGTNFQCQCAPGYTGSRCSQVLNPCSTLPCLNNGFCQWSGVPTVYTCQCTLGFVGTRCQTPLNPCNSNPCQNSGFCNWQSPNYAYQCQCPQTFTGINCETPIGPCFSNPCVNGGQCFTSNSGAGYFCNCMGNFKGINCQYPEPCFSNPCINNGDCNSPITGSSYTCTCLNSYQGPNCQYPNPCNSQPCQNGGLCLPNSVGTSFQCNCPSNFLGVFCQIGNPCISNPCLNGGACRTDTTGSAYFCNCVNNFIGLRCQFTNPCSSNPCQNGAICSQANSGQTYTCSCINGFFGTNCETPDPCRSFPCSNGGNCIITNGGFGYNCNCPQQFMGVTCQYPNPCSSNPCLNGGFCESHPLGISYTCSCQANFQGMNCAIRNPCASNPCINGGVCQLGVDGTSFFCNCPQQYMGLRCENLNPCLQQPCQNGGTCTPLSQGLEYRCSCLPSFYGITCEIRDPCSSSPCLNGGVCSQTASGYFCSCPTGFNGINCNNMNPCGGNPCQNGGTCVESAAPSGFFCRCTSAYIGTTCTIPDLCSFEPCQNGGTCTNSPTGTDYSCQCPTGYVGVRCEEFNPCISNPCRNGGTCNRDSQGTIYSCICVTGYAGRDCEFGPNCFSVSDFRCGSGECVSLSRQCDRSFDCTDGSDENNCQVACTAQEFTCAPGICISRDLICNGINNCNNDLDEQNCPLPCDSGPCLNGGICSNVGTSFICTCTSGWMGVTCAIPTTSSNAAPVFGGNSYTTTKPESIAVGSNIFHLVATDVDSPSLTFSLEDEVAKQLFIVVPDGPYGAYLTLKQQLDREVQDVYEFVVSVSDGANQVLQGGTLLVSDVNDNAPTFTNLPNTTTVHENVNFGYNVFVVNAEDRDAAFAGVVTYSISEDTPGPFTINAFTGTVTVSGNLDYETDEVYNIKIIAKDSATNSLSTEEYLTINIVDVQDAGPEFLNPPYDTAIDEGTPVNTVVQQVVAVDKDTLNPNSITYSIISGNQGSFFALNPNTGEITVIRELDREDPNLPPSVEFNIRAMENGPGGGQSAFTTFSIAINDLNDEPPMFDQSVYSVSVSEAELPGYVLPVNIHVTDGDVMIQGNFRITLQNGNIVPFSVSPSSAVDQATVTLTLIRPLDYETTKTYNLQLFAEDSASSSATVVVTVTDANDNNPLFTNPIQPITLREGSLQNTPVITISTTDADEGTNAVTKYRIVGGNQDNLFTINPDTGVITTTSNVDYENSARTYTLTIEAYNTAPAVPPATGVSITTLVVSIEDINDNPPVFQPSFYNRTVYEDADTGRTIVRVFASDADAGPAGDIRYSIIGGNVDGSFSINAQTGDVILVNRLDRETLDFYDIVIRAEDNVVPSQSATAHLTVYVGDSNDNSPQWSQLQYSQSLLEGLPANTFVTQVSATDIDLGMNAKLQYYLATPSQYFWINQTTGQIYTSMPLDREQMESITLNVMVRDLGNPQRNSAQPATVMVTVLDVNDTPPTFTGIPYNFEVAENRPFGTSVGQATAQDPDTIGTLVYSILSQTSNFFIDSTTGRITTINSLDREQLSNYEFEVQVTDGLHTATETVAVTVTDENDNDPVFTGGSLYELTVVENMPAGLILRLQATDADEGLNKKIVYQFDPTSNPPFGLFYLDQETGELRTTGPLDREVQDMYTLVVVAKDRNGEPGGRSAIATVLVTVTDVNDNKPYFDLQSYSQSVPEDIVLGGFITKVEAIDRDIGENAVILYRIIEGNEENHFSIDTNGTITRGPVPLDRETKVFYQLSVEAYNAGDLQPRNTATVTITVTDVNDEVPVFTQNVYLRPDLMENSPGGTQVATVLANDPDEGLGGQVLYSLTGGDSGFFFIDSQNGIITVQGSLPGFDVQQSYNLTVTATDQAQPFHSSTSTVMVHLVDAQDDPPEFTMDKYEVHLDENTGQGYPFLQVAAAIPGKPNSVVTYSLEPNVNPIILELFELDAATGMLTTKKPIDYEAGQNLYTFTVLGESDGVLSGSTAVWVYIDDVNDNNPVFVNPQTEVTVTENNNPGFIFTTVTATDADFGQNAELVYVITGGNQLGHFDLVTDVNGATHIATSTSLDREAIENYTLTITAADKGEPSRNSSINITVNVGDVNDNAPMYNQTINAASVVENILLNRPIGTIVFTDFDLPSSNNVEFYIDDMSNPNGIFQINSLGQITMTGPLDRESQAFYDLVVVMRDQTFNAGFSETTHFYINVTDQNDNQPIFPPQPPVVVTEGPSSTGNIFVTVTADDNDFGQNSNVIYTITGGNADGIFGIHQNNGSIYVIKELDWESTKNYELIVTATDQAGNVNDRRTGTVTVTVNVEDINDTPPVFPMNYYGPYNFYEGVSGTYIGTFVASDADSGLGGQITYTLIGNLSNLFFIHPDTGVLSLKPTAELDYEFISDFNLTIIATDAGTPSFSGNTTVGINVLNINDHSPQFIGTPYRVSINDTEAIGSLVFNVMATDADVGPDGNITYSIFDGNTGEMFWINPLTGNVYVNKTLTNGAYVLIVKAKDNPLNPQDSKEATGTLTILVTDSTSTIPVLINNGLFNADVYEHSPEGTYVTTVAVANPADVGQLTYSISGPDAAPFFINPVTGIITVSGVLDIEVKDRHVFEVTAIGSSGVSATGSVDVNILNINDYPPVIGQTFNFSVPEDATNDHFVGVVTATDQDYGSTTFHFSILSGGEDKFAIDPDTGTITVFSVCRGDVCDPTPLDREIKDLYTLNVQVSDLGSPLLSAQEVVYIHVTDVNDFRPAFDFTNIVVSVEENAMLNKPITTVQASDQDLSASLIYIIESVTATDLFGNTPSIDVSQWFSINSTTGVVYVSGQLDRENASEVVLTISGTDLGSNDVATSTTEPDATVTISITDINEHGPVFQPDGTTVIDTSVQEESAVGTIIINVEAIDPDNPINGMVTYMLTGNSSQYAYINPITGQITVNKNIDRELLNWLNFTVVATDSGNPSLSTSIPITVQVLDVNDNNPVFNQSEYVTTVTENTGSGTFVIVTPATDKDKGQYGTVTYKLTGGNGFFTIDSNTGEITTLQSLDQETQGIYTLTVTATDNEGGSDSRQNTTTVVVYVGDVNEHAPTVNPNFNFDVDENLPNRTFVGVIDATDADNPMETFNFTFTFANPSDGNNVFYIDKNTGEIFTNQQIDSDSSLFAKNYTFTILVSDNGNPSKTTETTTTINIKDLNDNNPVFVNAPYNITISELFTGNVMTVTGEDIDKNSILTYKIVNGNSNDTFFINPSTGVITVSNRLDFESRKKYNLTLLVEDQDGRSSTSHVVINIKDANDQTPVFVGPLPYQFNVFENVALGTDVGTIFATDADSDPTNSQLTYHIVNNVPFTINEISGLIQTSGMLDRETQDRYLLDVQVRNQGHTVDTQVLINILDVNDNAPTFGGEDNITRSFPENSEGNFPIYQPSATDADIGENARITYSIVSGNVENIFSINPKTGAIVLSRPITTLTDLVHNFKLIVEARDNGTNKLYSNITLNMVVGDYNDNGPVFIHPNVTVLTLPENQPIGYIISSILATDRDTGTNGMVTYGFLNEDGTHFTLQPDGDGALLLSNFIADREKQDRYTLVLLASDGSDTNKRETPLELTILITDENDNEPFFIRLDENTAVVQFLNITEHSSSGTSTGTVNQASDLDLAPFNNIYYYIVGGNGNGTFRIDKNTGEIFVVGDLDRETTGFHNLIVKATNNATYVPSGIFDVTTDTTLKQIQIEVKDINDNGPQFNQKIYISSILTNAEEQTQVSCIRATDVDLGDSVDYTIQSVSYTLDGQTTTFDDTFYIEKGTGCIRSNKILTGVGAGGFFDISVVATDNSGKSDSANVRVFTLDDKQKVVLIVDGSREDVIKQQAALIEVLKSITGGEVVIDDVTTYINENGVLVPGQTMVTFHVIDQNTNSAIAAAEILRLIDINRATINTLFQKYAVVEAFALGGGAGGAAFGILEAALLAIALLLFLGALIFIIILCCLQRRFLKKIHGNSPAVIYATRADADVKEAAAYQGSNPLWLESADSYPDDWPDSISLLGGGVNREYESQEASMDFFSDMQTEVARDALVMTALVNDGSMHGQAGTGRVKTLSNGGVASNGRISSNGRLAGGGVAASGGGFGSGAGRSGAGRSGAGMSSTTTTQMSSSGARLVDGIDGSAGTLTNRLNRDGSVTANLNSGAQDGGYSGSSASYTYSSVGFGGPGPSASGGQRLTSDKAHEIRQMLNEDETVEATFLDGTMYGNGDNSAGMAAARAVYREDVEFENQLSPITEEDTTSSWSSWTRDSERSGGRHPGGTLERNRTTGRSSKDYQDPMNNYTTSTSVEENYTHSIKKPSQTESSSYSRRANSKTYSAGVPTSIGMVTLTEETPEMIGLDADEDSEAESSIVDGRTYTYNVMGDNASEGAHSLSGTSSGHSSSRRKETNMITQEDDDDDDDEAGEIIEETETRRSKKTTRAYTNSGYDDYMDEESRL